MAPLIDERGQCGQKNFNCLKNSSSSAAPPQKHKTCTLLAGQQSAQDLSRMHTTAHKGKRVDNKHKLTAAIRPSLPGLFPKSRSLSLLSATEPQPSHKVHEPILHWEQAACLEKDTQWSDPEVPKVESCSRASTLPIYGSVLKLARQPCINRNECESGMFRNFLQSNMHKTEVSNKHTDY